MIDPKKIKPCNVASPEPSKLVSQSAADLYGAASAGNAKYDIKKQSGSIGEKYQRALITTPSLPHLGNPFISINIRDIQTNRAVRRYWTSAIHERHSQY